eukprot:m.85770 g.85770  ORF g.85770 m.85770 type:complete len:898 (+) comp19796_c0_seq2:74-2767(+)
MSSPAKATRASIDRLYAPPKKEKAEPVSIGIGDRVVVDGTLGGTLRFWGTVQFSTGKWAGVELDLPSGKNDGRVNGKRYYSCTDRHGLFVKLSSLTHELAVDGVSAPLAIAEYQQRIENMEGERDAAINRAKEAAAEAEECRVNGARGMEIAAELAEERAVATELRASIVMLKSAQTDLRIAAATARDAEAAAAETLRVGANNASADKTKWNELLTQSRQEISERELQNEAISRDAAATRRQVEQLQLEHREAVSTADGLRARLTALEQERHTAAAEDGALESRRNQIVETAKARATHLQSTVTQLEVDMAALRRESAAIKLAVEERDLALEGQELKLASVARESNSAKSLMEHTTATLAEWTGLGFSNPSEVTAAIAASRADTTMLRAEIGALSAAKDEMETAHADRVKEHAERVAALQTEETDRSTMLSAATAEIAVLRGEIALGLTEIASLKSSYASVADALKTSKASAATATTETLVAETKFDAIEQRLADVNTVVAEAIAERDLASERLVHMLAKTKALEDQLEVEKERSASSSAAVTELTGVRGELAATMEKLTAQHQGQALTLESLDKVIAERDHALADCEMARIEVEVAQSELDGANHELARFHADTESVAARLLDAEAKVAEFNVIADRVVELEVTEVELEGSMARCANLATRVLELEAIVADDSQLSEIKQALDEKEQALVEKETELLVQLGHTVAAREMLTMTSTEAEELRRELTEKEVELAASRASVNGLEFVSQEMSAAATMQQAKYEAQLTALQLDLANHQAADNRNDHSAPPTVDLEAEVEVLQLELAALRAKTFQHSVSDVPSRGNGHTATHSGVEHEELDERDAIIDDLTAAFAQQKALSNQLLGQLEAIVVADQADGIATSQYQLATGGSPMSKHATTF